MGRSVKLLTPLVTLAVVLGAEAVHATFIGRYAFTAEPRFAWVLVLAALLLVTTYAAGVNEPAEVGSARIVRATMGVASAVATVGVIQLVSRRPLLPLFVLGVSVVVLPPALFLVSMISVRARQRRGGQERVVALIGPEEIERLRREVMRAPERPCLLSAVVAPDAAIPKADDPAPLLRLVQENSATLVVLDREAQSLDEIVSQAAHIHSAGVRIRTLSLFYDEWLGRLPISELERIALLFDINEIHHPTYARLKRLIDILLSVCGLALLVVAIPIVWILDLAGNRGPLFYQQDRVGKDGKIFSMVKFRTMVPATGPSDWTTAGDPRLRHVGRLLRRLHLDELPQVLNVLRRELSIVGPRPEQPRYVEQLTEKIPFYDSRHLVRPGITGWAQVKYDYGSNELDALEKLQYEFFYLRHQSLLLDLRIIGRTLQAIFVRGGR